MNLDYVVALASQRQMGKDTIGALERFRAAQQQGGLFVDSVPLYSRVSLRGFADATTAQFNPQTIKFFNGVAGSAGTTAGFAQNRPLTDADTNLEGQGGVVPGGTAYVMTHMGLIVAPEAPQHIKEAIVYNSTIEQFRGANNRLPFGGSQFWPAAEFGIQAAAASTSVANQTINQATNGRTALIPLPESSWIILPPQQPINFVLNVRVPFFCTTNNQAEAGANAISNSGITLTNQTEILAYVTLVLRGTRLTTVGV